MKKLNAYLFTFSSSRVAAGVCLALMTGCTKPPVEPCDPMPCDSIPDTRLGLLDTLWTTNIDPQTRISLNFGTFYQNGHVLIGYSPDPSSAGLLIVNPDNPTSKNYFITQNVDNFGSMHPVPDRQEMILQTSGWSSRIGIPDAEHKQQHQFTLGWSSNTFGSVIGQYFFNSRRSENHDTCYLIRASVDDLTRWDTVYTLVQGLQTGDSRPNVQSYNLWIHPQTGDSILVMQHRMAFPTRADVLAFNLSKREVVWKHENLTPDGNSNHQPIFIHDNKAYFGGSKVFYCFDLITGKILWTFDDPEGKTTFMIHKTDFCPTTNSIIVRAGGNLYSFIPNTGSLNWSVFIDGDSSSGSPSVYNGIIYITSNLKVMAIRASDGKILWREFENGPKWGTPSFRGDIAIDPERKCFYVVDRLRLYAIKL
jgi:hypothetical protein